MTFMLNDSVLQVFGERLKTIRLEHNLTQQELADQLGMSQTMIAYWEKGKREIRMSDLMEIVNFFQVDVNYFLGTADASIVTNDGKVARFSKKDFEVLSLLQKDKKFMKEISDNTEEKIQAMLQFYQTFKKVNSDTDKGLED